MTEQEQKMIDAYIPSPRDESLDEGFEYYVKDCGGRVFRVYISGIFPHFEGDTTHSVFTEGGKRITDSTSDGNFPLRHMYDNKQDCKDETHNFYSNWELLRKLQETESETHQTGA